MGCEEVASETMGEREEEAAPAGLLGRGVGEEGPPKLTPFSVGSIFARLPDSESVPSARQRSTAFDEGAEE